MSVDLVRMPLAFQYSPNRGQRRGLCRPQKLDSGLLPAVVDGSPFWRPSYLDKNRGADANRHNSVMCTPRLAVNRTSPPWCSFGLLSGTSLVHAFGKSHRLSRIGAQFEHRSAGFFRRAQEGSRLAHKRHRRSAPLVLLGQQAPGVERILGAGDGWRKYRLAQRFVARARLWYIVGSAMSPGVRLAHLCASLLRRRRAAFNSMFTHFLRARLSCCVAPVTIDVGQWVLFCLLSLTPMSLNVYSLGWKTSGGVSSAAFRASLQELRFGGRGAIL